MAKNNRRGVEYPKEFMKVMKKQKRKKMRSTSVYKEIIEKRLNNASMEL